MMNWSVSSRNLIRSLSVSVLLLIATVSVSNSQVLDISQRSFSTTYRSLNYGANPARIDTTDYFPNYPDPTSVLYKSLILPGWGQVVNDQIWKVPIIYALLGGLTYYSIYLTKRYHDYRAAYYNLNDQTPNDFKFGPTPAYISPNANLNFLRNTRNSLHNRRDFIYVTIALAYGLNILDAYIFAHLRTFDVSEDLSMNATLKPTIMPHNAPGIMLSIKLF